ncbi:MAG: hypothetical protein MK538_01250 [Planctomycetes bacterium]|nr:hypothetical protein [Planctomycetota bacterium]
MSFSWRLLAALTVVSCMPVRHAPAESGALTGFRKAASDEQLKREERFASELDAKNLREWMKRMTIRPHHVGSPFGKEAIEERSWEEAQEHILIAAVVLERYGAEIARASNLLRSNRP